MERTMRITIMALMLTFTSLSTFSKEKECLSGEVRTPADSVVSKVIDLEKPLNEVVTEITDIKEISEIIARKMFSGYEIGKTSVTEQIGEYQDEHGNKVGDYLLRWEYTLLSIEGGDLYI